MVFSIKNKIILLILLFTVKISNSQTLMNRIWHIKENYGMYPEYTYHKLCHVNYYSNDLPEQVPTVTDSDEFTIKLERSYVEVKVQDLVPRWEDIRFFKYRYFLLNTDGNAFTGEDYVVWDIQEVCEALKRPKICYNIRFFPCRENAEVFYSTKLNTNKLRHTKTSFDKFDRDRSDTSTFGGVDDLENSFKFLTPKNLCPTIQ